MVRADHDAQWPDKMMFASLLVALGAMLGVVFDIGVLGGVQVGAEGLVLLEDYPTWLSLSLNGLALVLAYFGVRHQAWAPTFAGALLSFASLGFLLLTPVIAVTALFFMLKSAIEGEETKWDEHTVSAQMWPDKALAASMLLFVGALVTLFHSLYLYADGTDPLYAAGTPAIQATIGLVIAAFAFYASRQVFRLQGATVARFAAMALFLGAGFYFLGPVLGMFAFMMLGLAEKENEFTSQTHEPA